MKAQIIELLTKLKSKSISFGDVLAFIEQHYQHTPTAFKNGQAYNGTDQNQGSAKVFSFAKINHLNATDTLLLFAEHYQSVLESPNGSDHQNIRQFMINGWLGVVFEGDALTAKQS